MARTLDMFVRMALLISLLIHGIKLTRDSINRLPNYHTCTQMTSSSSSVKAVLPSFEDPFTAMQQEDVSIMQQDKPQENPSREERKPTQDPTRRRHRESGFIPLIELVQTNSSFLSIVEANQTCQPGDQWVQDTILPESKTHDNRKIPRIVHITSKSRCASNALNANMDLWRLPGHSFYYHDDAAVDRLLHKEWPEFPHLHLILNCLITGAAKADLWRYLVLWEYGGLYSDIDTAPGWRFNETVIQPDDDAWFVPEGLGVLTQYFMSASPKHPLMYMAVMETLNRLLNAEPTILDQYIPFVTGPGALKNAMIRFMGVIPSSGSNFQRVPAGHYVGMDDRSVTVCGSKATSNEWIVRNSVSGYLKRKGWNRMGQTLYGNFRQNMPVAEQQALNVSCFVHLHHVSFPRRQYPKRNTTTTTLTPQRNATIP